MLNFFHHTDSERSGSTIQVLKRRPYVPSGPPFVAYHGFDPLESDIEIGIPFTVGFEGKDNIGVSKIPGGKATVVFDRSPQF